MTPKPKKPHYEFTFTVQNHAEGADLFVDTDPPTHLGRYGSNRDAMVAHSATLALQAFLNTRDLNHLRGTPKGIYKRGKRFLVSYPEYKGYFNTLDEAVLAQQPTALP